MNIPFGKPIMGEEEFAAVREVMESGILVHGPKVKAFEEVFAAFTGARFAKAVASCTAGMHLFYFVNGLREGDEVLVPAQTHVATAHAVELAGGVPLFVDVDPLTGNMDPALAEAAITERTWGIAPVHYLGFPAAMDALCAVAKRHGLRVLEDCALALGARQGGVHSGLLGDAGSFSFYPVKHVTTSEGGMLITNDPELADAVARCRAFGVDRHYGERAVPGMYNVDRLGFNYRMNELSAAMGIEQMKRVQGFLDARRSNFVQMAQELGSMEEVRILHTGDKGDYFSSHYCLCALLSERLAPRRGEIIKALKAKGVGSSVYYPHPVPRMAYYRKKYGYTDGAFPHAARISDGCIALPVGPHLRSEQIHVVVETFKSVVKEVS